MSAAAPLRRPVALRQPAALLKPAAGKVASARPRLVLVSQRRTSAGRLPFMIVVGSVLVVGLVGVLLLHMFAAQDAYRANALQQRLTTLSEAQQQAQSVVDADSSPTVLRAQAAALGMVPTGVTSFHKLKDGRAIGLQTPIIVAPPAPPVTTKKTATSSKAGSSKAGSPKAGAAGSAKQGAAGTKAHKGAAGTSPLGQPGSAMNGKAGATVGRNGKPTGKAGKHHDSPAQP
jgi:cytoskeletal protein RodZ